MQKHVHYRLSIMVPSFNNSCQGFLNYWSKCRILMFLLINLANEIISKWGNNLNSC